MTEDKTENIELPMVCVCDPKTKETWNQKRRDLCVRLSHPQYPVTDANLLTTLAYRFPQDGSMYGTIRIDTDAGGWHHVSVSVYVEDKPETEEEGAETHELVIGLMCDRVEDALVAVFEELEKRSERSQHEK